jgi:hypothetical protein
MFLTCQDNSQQPRIADLKLLNARGDYLECRLARPLVFLAAASVAAGAGESNGIGNAIHYAWFKSCSPARDSDSKGYYL